jgi:ankyrin repeat protein
MSDALPLPPRPHLDQYKKLARDLQQACQSADAGAVRAWATRWVEALFRLQGLDTASSAQRRDIARESERIEGRWKSFRKADERRADCLLADAQFFVAREHGFASWPKFAAHLETLTHPDSAVSNFEAAVEAIIAGDGAALRRLLRDHAELVNARSTRDHRSTLLHYVSANGVEDFRQKTPPNIVEITRILLQAGADVNATSDAYGGGSTALGLAATSLHPEQAGVQIALLETLLENGAKIEQGAAEDDGSAVTGCLGNGQPVAASFLASRGAVLNLEGAAGLGRLDILETFFDASGALLRGATKDQVESGFLYACGYGHLHIVRFLLEKGIHSDVRNRGGETGLHWASFGPHPDVARELLQRRASVDVRDNRFEGTPLDWALFAWAKSDGQSRERGYDLAKLLVEAGAKVHLPWLEPATAEQARTDPRMQEILRDAIVTNVPDVR